jgi:hypothetical protein
MGIEGVTVDYVRTNYRGHFREDGYAGGEAPWACTNDREGFQHTRMLLQHVYHALQRKTIAAARFLHAPVL